MGKEDTSKALENALTHVNEGRRGFLKTLLIGSAAVAVLPLMTSTVVAQGNPAPPAKGDAPADGDGKGDGKGGDGKGGGGKGKGKGGKGKGNPPADGAAPATPPA